MTDNSCVLDLYGRVVRVDDSARFGPPSLLIRIHQTDSESQTASGMFRYLPPQLL